ncbi:hypothetical protein AT705_22365 [Pseudoalteromonas rubra]|uniref:Uncharacterized protein n=1 Tax=Pseudoalteromonas rubra TaxID=43658 RepID=A0A0U3HRW8_9GAMM|nr:hypothetical protein AT705_22365 [Pseudoalteromonas rubra]
MAPKKRVNIGVYSVMARAALIWVLLWIGFRIEKAACRADFYRFGVTRCHKHKKAALSDGWWEFNNVIQGKGSE